MTYIIAIIITRLKANPNNKINMLSDILLFKGTVYIIITSLKELRLDKLVYIIIFIKLILILKVIIRLIIIDIIIKIKIINSV